MLSRVFCMTLRTYGLVIGWMGMIFNFLIVILMSVFLIFSDEILFVDPGKSAEHERDPVYAFLLIGASVFLGLAVISFLASTMLLVGIVKERHLLLLPWLIKEGVLICLSIAVHLFLGPEIMMSIPFWAALRTILFSMSCLALGLYLYYGIYSLYKQIQSSSAIKSADCTRLRADQDLGYSKVYAGL